MPAGFAQPTLDGAINNASEWPTTPAHGLFVSTRVSFANGIMPGKASSADTRDNVCNFQAFANTPNIFKAPTSATASVRYTFRTRVMLVLNQPSRSVSTTFFQALQETSTGITPPFLVSADEATFLKNGEQVSRTYVKFVNGSNTNIYVADLPRNKWMDLSYDVIFSGDPNLGKIVMYRLDVSTTTPVWQIVGPTLLTTNTPVWSGVGAYSFRNSGYYKTAGNCVPQNLKAGEFWKTEVRADYFKVFRVT